VSLTGSNFFSSESQKTRESCIFDAALPLDGATEIQPDLFIYFVSVEKNCCRSKSQSFVPPAATIDNG
jgi:hypothetical protein